MAPQLFLREIHFQTLPNSSLWPLSPHPYPPLGRVSAICQHLAQSTIVPQTLTYNRTYNTSIFGISDFKRGLSLPNVESPDTDRQSAENC
jgi:hypothetical protein